MFADTVAIDDTTAVSVLVAQLERRKFAAKKGRPLEAGRSRRP